MTLFQGAGYNVVAMPGPDGTLMIDAGLAATADAPRAAVRAATGTTRIHTHWHPEQTEPTKPSVVAAASSSPTRRRRRS